MTSIIELKRLYLYRTRYNQLYLEWIQLMKKNPSYRLGQHICNEMLSANETFPELYYLEPHIELFNYITLINEQGKTQ